jgi:hypothetical protein
MEQKKAQEFVEQAVKEAGVEVYGETGAAAPGGSNKTPATGRQDEKKK